MEQNSTKRMHLKICPFNQSVKLLECLRLTWTQRTATILVSLRRDRIGCSFYGEHVFLTAKLLSTIKAIRTV